MTKLVQYQWSIAILLLATIMTLSTWLLQSDANSIGSPSSATCSWICVGFIWIIFVLSVWFNKGKTKHDHY